MEPDLPSTVQAHPAPAGKPDLAKDAAKTAWRAKEQQREKGKVEMMGAERLVLAQERYKAFRARQLREREAAAEALQRDISKVQEHLWKTQMHTDESLEELEAQKRVYEVDEVDAKQARQRAQQRVIASREEGAAYALRAADEAQQALQEAEEVISTKKAEVKSLVDQHCDERAVFKAKLQKEVAAQDREAAAFAETVLVQTKSCHRQQEASRHNAAMHLEKVADLHQAARGEAQERMLLHEEKSKRHVKDLEKITHQLRMRGDEALVEKMSHTTAQLVAAKTFCAEVKESLNEEIRQAKLNMAKIQEEAAANTRNEQRAVQGLEAKALDQFLASLEEASGAWHETSGKRKALQEELDELHVKFQSLHDETQARMKAIMDLWRKDREAMEEKIQVLEVKRQDAFQVVTRTMQETKDGMQAKERAARESCAEAVSQCQRQSEDTVVATYEAAAEAAKNEELVAEQVLVEAQQWKSQIKDLQAAADEEIAAIEAKAASVEIQLEKDALAQVNLSKRLAQSAAEEEKVFISETAAAWARVRKACYQLRLASLHDFARSIANGQFDSKLD